jgi:cellulose synthase/poly-beta-1,6-N-acetylglucosamine synthase-like glycosyltransferase/peptidoglycan/xylan/chitin deacetylase (PgdA/CDA1 family)
LIASERFDAYPANYRVDRWGSQDRQKIALTFDDGPDPQYTSRVLDVLEQFHVPATFFVTGMSADRHANLLKRELEAGHAIGNHTFTHPDLTTISTPQLQFELNATERVFESQLGRQSLLFRPPYGEDVDPVTADQLKPLLTTSAMGYYTVGMQIDPEDWRSPGVDQIVQQVLRQAAAGGHVILLHDGGGDRTQTVTALPKIIEELRARGYELVLVSELMRLDRDQLMPPLSPLQKLGALINGIGFALLSGAQTLLSFLFAAGILLGAVRLFFVVLLAVIPRRKKRTAPARYPPQVTVIVPAFNEEKVVGRTIRSLLDSTFLNLDIIVVDDGSTDRTYSLLQEMFWDEPQVSIYTKANSGKADSLNFALSRTNAEIIVAIDADTIVLPEAVEKLVPHFADPRVGAVAGNAKVGNRINLLTEWQALEYITSQNLDRRAFALVNGITVVPGAIGAWRRALVQQAGGFSSDTLAEDAALTMAILRLGFQVDYEADAIALTEAPDTLSGFLRQRFRWMYGTLQAAWKNRDALFRPRYGALGMVALPHVFLFQVLFPILSPFMDLTLVVALAQAGWQQFESPGTLPDSLAVTLFFYALFLAMDYIAAFVAFLLERGEDKTLLAWLFLQRLFYRQLLYYVALQATLTAIRGPAVGWGKLERKATVPGR